MHALGKCLHTITNSSPELSPDSLGASLRVSLTTKPFTSFGWSIELPSATDRLLHSNECSNWRIVPMVGDMFQLGIVYRYKPSEVQPEMLREWVSSKIEKFGISPTCNILGVPGCYLDRFHVIWSGSATFGFFWWRCELFLWNWRFLMESWRIFYEINNCWWKCELCVVNLSIVDGDVNYVLWNCQFVMEMWTMFVKWSLFDGNKNYFWN